MNIIVPGIVLCAGRSNRMGHHKALLPTSRPDETFVGRIVRILREAGVDDVVVVVGPELPLLDRVLERENPPPRLVVNPSPERGQLSSLLTGLRVVDRPGVGGILVTLVDVPMIDVDAVRRLRLAHDRSRAPVVRLVRNGHHGHPVIFDRVVFDELRQANHDSGAKAVVRAHAANSVEVEVETDGPFLDVDTPADYQRIFGKPPPIVDSRLIR